MRTLRDMLDAALVAEPPVQARDGGFIAPGHDADLDAARTLRDEGRGVIAKLQADYIADTGVQSLKIKHNNVLGYFIETTATHAQKMLSPPLSERFIHRQTTANAVRFTTLDLSELETRILNAGSRALEIEMPCSQPCATRYWPKVIASGRPRGLGRAGRGIRAGHARDRGRLVPPAIHDDRASRSWRTPPGGGGRFGRTGAPFVANDCILDPGGDGRDHAADRAQHGRQIHLAQAERTDRDPCPDGKLRTRRKCRDRAGEPGVSPASVPRTTWRAGARPSWSRWWKPPRS
jgi:DNA mismatch repair protein MutS